MTTLPEPARAVPWRARRGVGLLLLAHFAGLCLLKLRMGELHEIWWMSHMALLLAGVGLTVSSRLLVVTALTAVLVPHGLWLADFFCWLATGVFPLRLTCYMADASWWVRLGTMHHFYLSPLLLILVVRHQMQTPAAQFAAMVGYLFLTLLCRVTTSPVDNVNWAFGLFAEFDHPLVNAINLLPGGAYLLVLNGFMFLMARLGTALIDFADSLRRTVPMHRIPGLRSI